MKDVFYKITNFFSQAMILFSIMITIMTFIIILFGNQKILDGNVLPFYKFGDDAISIPVILQFFVLAIIITFLKTILFSEKILKKATTLWKTVGFLLIILITIIIFILVFKWFPLNMISAWISFIVSFIICTSISLLFMIFKSNHENEKYKKQLMQYKTKKKS